MLAILEGDFAPRTADRLLSSIEFSYSVKWIYDAKNRAFRRNVGGIRRSYEYGSQVPGSDRIAGRGFTVGGAIVRTLRILLRGYAPNNILDRPDRTELIRLRFDK